MPATQDAAEEQVLRSRLAGATLRELADQHDLSIEGVRFVVARASRRRIDNLELALMVAGKAEQIGQEAAWPTFLVPFQDQDDWQAALSYFAHCLKQLRARGLSVAVKTRPTPSGTAFQIVNAQESP